MYLYITVININSINSCLVYQIERINIFEKSANKFTNSAQNVHYFCNKTSNSH